VIGDDVQKEAQPAVGEFFEQRLESIPAAELGIDRERVYHIVTVLAAGTGKSAFSWPGRWRWEFASGRRPHPQ
jgi:hypothetical protein